MSDSELLDRIASLEAAIKDIREHMLTKGDIHVSNRPRDPEGSLEEVERVMEGER